MVARMPDQARDNVRFVFLVFLFQIYMVWWSFSRACQRWRRCHWHAVFHWLAMWHTFLILSLPSNSHTACHVRRPVTNIRNRRREKIEIPFFISLHVAPHLIIIIYAMSDDKGIVNRVNPWVNCERGCDRVNALPHCIHVRRWIHRQTHTHTHSSLNGTEWESAMWVWTWQDWCVMAAAQYPTYLD